MWLFLEIENIIGIFLAGFQGLTQTSRLKLSYGEAQRI
jgi:hypothetical protein